MILFVYFVSKKENLGFLALVGKAASDTSTRVCMNLYPFYRGRTRDLLISMTPRCLNDFVV